MATDVSRLILSHPDLGAAGGAGLHASITAMYKKIGDNMSSRMLITLSLANSATATVEHDFRDAFSDMRWDLYIIASTDPYDFTRITSSSSPALSSFAVAANITNPTTQIDITNNSGSSRNLCLVVHLDPLKLSEGDIQDVDTSSIAPTSGDALIWNGTKWAPAAVSIPATAQDFSGLKRFLGGISSVEYVGTNPEVGGSTPFQLTVAHKRVQVINPAGAITVLLPTTSLKQGERLKIVNRSTNLVTIQSSGANELAVIKGNSFVEFIALQDTPTSAAHWSNIAHTPAESTLLVGVGANRFSTLSAALTAAVSGDRILILTDVAETAAINIPAGVDVDQAPGTLVTLTATAFASGAIRVTGAKGRWRNMNAKVTGITGTLAKAVSVEAADCKVLGDLEIDCTGQTVTDAVNINSSGLRAYIQVGVLRTAGTITNLETNADGAGKSDVWGG